jgi:hypothetical protein
MSRLTVESSEIPNKRNDVMMSYYRQAVLLSINETNKAIMSYYRQTILLSKNGNTIHGKF